jgi:hypothetical protein
MLKFLRNYPWKFYLKTFFRAPHIVTGAMLVKEDRVSILSPIKDKLSFRAGLRDLAGAPLLNSSSRPSPETAFRSEVLSRRTVNEAFQWVFVVDTPDAQIHQVDAHRYGIGRELTPAGVGRLVPNATMVGLSYWELLSATLGANDTEATSVSILFGLPKSAARNLEDWANYLGSRVTAIIPLPLVLLEESISLSPTGIHIVLTTNHTVIALTQEKEVKLITRVEPVHKLGISRIVATLETLGGAFPEISRSPARLISCDLAGLELTNHAQAVSADAVPTRPEELQDVLDMISGASSSPIEAVSLYRALCLVASPKLT